jgi:hypothetical protein
MSAGLVRPALRCEHEDAEGPFDYRCESARTDDKTAAK